MLANTKLIICLLGAACMSACCTTASTDPRSGGLRGGACGIATGAYDERLADLNAQRSALNRIEHRLETQRRDLRVANTDVSFSISDQADRLRVLLEELNGLMRLAERQDQSAELQQLQEEIHHYMRMAESVQGQARNTSISSVVVEPDESEAELLQVGESLSARAIALMSALGTEP